MSSSRILQKTSSGHFNSFSIRYTLYDGWIGDHWQEIDSSICSRQISIAIDRHFKDIVTHWRFRCSCDSRWTATTEVDFGFPISPIWTRAFTIDETEIVAFYSDRINAIPSSKIVRRGTVQIQLRYWTEGADFEVIITTSFEKTLKSFKKLYLGL